MNDPAILAKELFLDKAFRVFTLRFIIWTSSSQNANHTEAHSYNFFLYYTVAEQFAYDHLVDHIVVWVRVNNAIWTRECRARDQ